MHRPITSVQATQAQIPQFFNFIGSSAGNMTTPLGGKMFASSEPVVEKPPKDLQQEVSELIQRHDDERKSQEKRAEENRRSFQMMMNTPRPFIDLQSNENSDAADEYSGTTISPSEAARIRAEVQGVMKQQFAQARANAMAISNLEKKLAAQVSTSRSGGATADGDVIDLITQYVTLL